MQTTLAVGLPALQDEKGGGNKHPSKFCVSYNYSTAAQCGGWSVCDDQNNMIKTSVQNLN